MGSGGTRTVRPGAIPPNILTKIDALVAQARPAEAAELAAHEGLHARAAELCEQSCDFGRASDHAGSAGDLRRSIVLAALAGDPKRIERAAAAIIAEPNRARAAAAELSARGHGKVAAQLLERVGDLEDAARFYADAGLAVESANAYQAIGMIRDAARVLESAHRTSPHDEAVAVRLAKLLVQRKRFEAATRVLQPIAASSPNRPYALPLLAACYEALGLDDPLDTLRREARAGGVALESNEIGRSEGEAIANVVYGRYEILQLVASTPSARVFEALDRVTRQRVAVKQLQTEGLVGAGRDAFERMTREARALEQIRHPNVVPLIELISASGAVITPWMSGGSLADLMGRERITPTRAVEIAAAVLSALGEAHRLGILHRDVKPSNILFDDAGVPRLADFGAAHVSDTSVTVTAGVIGTLAYMAPEQRCGQPATPSSDVYGVGATLCEMLTGQPPPLSGEVPALPSTCHPDMRDEHDALLCRLIAQEATHRTTSALDARKQLLETRWPRFNRGDAPQRSDRATAEDDEERLQSLERDVYFDRWLGRRVRVVKKTNATLRVAQAYAAAGGPGLGGVVCFDAQHDCLWFELPDGPMLSEAARRLTRDESAKLAHTLEALHRRAVAHGAVDAHHIVLRGGEPVLVFDPATFEWATAEQDMAALLRLS